MHHRYLWRLAGLGLAAAWLCTSASAFVAQAPTTAAAPATLTVLLPGARSPVASQFLIVFSEPMVAEPGGNPGSLAYLDLTPAVPVTLRWTSTSTLEVTSTAGGFPAGRPVTVRIAAEARALSGARLAADVSTTVVGKPLSATMVGRRRPGDGRVVLVLHPDRALTPAQLIALMSAIHYQPYRTTVTAPSAELRRELSRRDPAALARIEAAARTAASSAGLSRRVPVRRVAGPPRPEQGQSIEGLPVAPRDVVVETIEVPPPDVRLIVGTPRALDAPQATAPSWQSTPSATSIVAIVDTLRLAPTHCGAACTGSTIGLTSSLPIDPRTLQRAFRLVDVTDPAAERIVTPVAIPPVAYPVTAIALTSLGYADLPSGHRYLLSADAGLTATGGQRMPTPWFDVLTTAMREPVATVGNRRDAVWERGLGPRLPVVTRTLRTVEAGAAAVPVEALPTALNRIGPSGEWATAPRPPLSTIAIPGSDDAVRNPLVDASKVLGANGSGFVWLVAKAGEELPRPDNVITVYPHATLPSAVLVQVTNLGVTVRALGDSVLVFVTTLDTGAAVAGATVTVLDERAHPLWRGVTDAHGVARTDVGGESPAAGVPRLVLVEHDGDRAFGEPISGWGVDSWLGPSRNEALEGVLLTDRGVYRPGEVVHVKAILRRRSADRIEPLPNGTTMTLTLDRDTDRLATIEGRVGVGGGIEWAVPIAADAELTSTYFLTVHPGEPEPPPPLYDRTPRLTARFAVKEVRPLEFEVEPTLTRGPQRGTAGDRRGSVDVHIAARDLTAVPLRTGHVSWTLRRYGGTPFQAPAPFTDFQVDSSWSAGGDEPIAGQGRLESGVFSARIDVPAGLDGLGYVELEATVIDGDTAQAVTTTTTATFHPDAYLGIRADGGTETAPRASVTVVALDPTGRPVAGVPISLVARSTLPEGRPLPPVRVVSAAEPIEVRLPGLETSTLWSVEATGDTTERVVAPASTSAHIESPGLAPSTSDLSVSLDKARYATGERAHVTVQAPWSTGTALVTIEQHRVISQHVRPIDGRPIVLDVPIEEESAGGLTVSAIAVKGRTAACCGDHGADPGAPSVATADARIEVDPASTRLRVAIEPLTAKPGPGAATRWRVAVADAKGRPAPSEVTLWAVDEGWLRLTDYALPDVAATLLDRPLPQPDVWDSRRALLRRTIPDAWGVPVNTETSRAGRSFGEDDVAGDGRVRADRRPVAFWFGDLRTGHDGTVTVDAPALPETLTTYRVFAVAAAASRFGQATQALTVTSPVMLRPSPPRFLTRGDRATIPIAVTSLQDVPARGRLSIESLTPDLLVVDGQPPAVALAPGERRTITVGVRAMAAGQARLRVRIVTPEASDAVEHAFPILAPVVVERTAVSGQIDRTARAVIDVPRTGVDLDAGGLSVSVSGSLLAGVALAGRDLEGYAYLCLEQRTSRMLALALAAKEGGPFAFMPVRERDPVKALQQALRELPGFRCGGEEANGYGLWNGACRVSSPYLSAYLLYALQTIRGMAIPGVEVDEREIAQAADAVDAALRSAALVKGNGYLSEGWAALGLKALADEGRYPAAAGAAILARRNALPLWAVAHLYDAVLRGDPGRSERKVLEDRLVASITPNGVVDQAAPPAARADWTWPSEPKTTAIVLDVLTRHGKISKEQARRLALGLMHARRADGGWVSTQENAWALVALATYRREIEGGEATGAVTVTADLDGARLIEAELCDEHDPATQQLSMRDLQPRIGRDSTAALTFTASGDRPAFYTARLEVQRPAAGQPAVDHGLEITRRYEMQRGDTWVPVQTVTAGDVVRVSLTVRSPAARFLVAVSDPLPAGFEPIDPELPSTATALRAAAPSWWDVFDHVQRRDGRVDAFATYLPVGKTTFEYTARATTVGTFFAAAPRAELMYEPEVSGRGTSETIAVVARP